MSSDPLQAAKACELHVHVGGCYTVDDLIHLAGPYADQIDWSIYVEAYQDAFNIQPDPAAWIRRAASGDEAAIRDIHEHYVYTEADGANFARFMAKFSLALATLRHHHRIDSYDDCIAQAVDGQRQQGIDYVEFRAMAPCGIEEPERFIDFHQCTARVIAAACQPGFTARYVPSIPRWEPLDAYVILRQWLADETDLASSVVGFDFCHFEEGYPPSTTHDFFRRFHEDETTNDGPALEILYHVGEIYFDKSLESSMRWCHEAAELGARRLGHCTALGLDPAVAVTRQENAHEVELVSERIDQIDYDLRLRVELEDAGVEIDVRALTAEREDLRSQALEASVRSTYDETRLEQIRRRQDYVLAKLSQCDAVIESCPSSNMRLGSVPSAADHPVHRFLDSDVALVLGADDPGIFASPLAAEVDWVASTTSLTTQQLAKRLGDPRRYACGAGS
jgi:hypothetical protein